MAHIEVSLLSDTGVEDLPDFLQNHHGRAVVCLSSFVNAYEGEKLEFDVEALAVWILSNLPEDFSHYEMIKEQNTKAGALVESFMRKQIEEYESKKIEEGSN